MSVIDDFLAGGTGENAPSGHTADDGHDHSGAPWAKGLNAELSPRVGKLIDMYRDRGVDLRVVSGHRDIEEQRRLYAQGRTKPGKIVTWIKPENSRHVHGDAVDVVPFENGKPNWQAPESFWQQLGKDGVALGLEWGGNWKKTKDRPHFQLPKGGPPAMSAGLSMAMGPRESNLRRDMRQYYGGSVIDDFLSGGAPAPVAKATPAKTASNPSKYYGYYTPEGLQSGLLSDSKFLQHVADVEAKHKIPPGTLQAIMAKESKGNPNARSPADKQGLRGWGIGQFRNATARGLAKQTGIPIWRGNAVNMDPYVQATAMGELLSRKRQAVGGDWDDAAWAYNAGEKNVADYRRSGKYGQFADRVDPNYRREVVANRDAILKLREKQSPARTASAPRSVIDEFLGL